MKQKRHKPEVIIRLLRECDSSELNQESFCQQKQISLATLHRWREKYCQMDESDAKRLKSLEKENTEYEERLKKLEAVNAWTTKVSIISAAVAVLMGGGGILGYIQFFSEATDKRKMNAVEVFSKETQALITVAEKLDARRRTSQAEMLYNKVATLTTAYTLSQAKYIPMREPPPVPIVAASSKEDILRTLSNTKIEVAVGVILEG